MKLLLTLVAFVAGLQLALGKNLVCFYDSSSYLRPGFAKMQPSNLDIALEFCTHLIYGYAGLKPDTHEVFSLNVDLDMFYYQEICALKGKHPHLKVYLSVGGDQDIDEAHPLKYVELLESGRTAQQSFIDSAISILKLNHFDGLDLAFQLPRNKPRKVHGSIGTVWKQFKKLFTGDFVVDPKAADHRTQYTDFVKALGSSFYRSNLSLSMTVLPNVNSSWYFDPNALKNTFEFVNLAAFDFLTPDRNPEEADYTAPLYPLEEQNRLPHYNIDFQVDYWLKNLFPAQKLNVGVATYGRVWQLSEASGVHPLPVVQATQGPAAAGLQSQKPGLLSWPEICSKITNDVSKQTFKGPDAKLLKVTDLQQKHGNYASRPADENGEHGEWVSFDDPDFAGVKAQYVKMKGLGGVALFDLSYDDFRGQCSGQRFPFLRTVKYYL